jgi:hypothetical protein
MFRNLPRQTFGRLQSKLFPLYFALRWVSARMELLVERQLPLQCSAEPRVCEATRVLPLPTNQPAHWPTCSAACATLMLGTLSFGFGAAFVAPAKELGLLAGALVASLLNLLWIEPAATEGEARGSGS